MSVILRVGQLLEVGYEHYGVTVSADVVTLAARDLLYVVEIFSVYQGNAVRLNDGTVFSVMTGFTTWPQAFAEPQAFTEVS